MSEVIKEQTVTLTVNGAKFKITVHPMERLLDVIREEINLTGTKEGCGEGECGACTVLLDGVPVVSCMVPICQADGKSVTTIEGISRDGQLHPIQKAFMEKGGSQCGICTPGMIVSAAYYMDNPDSADNIREALAGNQCRCTGYTKIYDSLIQAYEDMDKEYPG